MQNNSGPDSPLSPDEDLTGQGTDQNSLVNEKNSDITAGICSKSVHRPANTSGLMAALFASHKANTTVTTVPHSRQVTNVAQPANPTLLIGFVLVMAGLSLFIFD